MWCASATITRDAGVSAADVAEDVLRNGKRLCAFIMMSKNESLLDGSEEKKLSEIDQLVVYATHVQVHQRFGGETSFHCITKLLEC